MSQVRKLSAEGTGPPGLTCQDTQQQRRGVGAKLPDSQATYRPHLRSRVAQRESILERN